MRNVSILKTKLYLFYKSTTFTLCMKSLQITPFLQIVNGCINGKDYNK